MTSLQCAACHQPVRPHDAACPHCGQPFQAPSPPAGDEMVATVIPYRNPSALLAYYLGVFSVICGIGFFLGIAAVILGVLGTNYRKKHPTAHGLAHAWVGIIVGGLTGVNLMTVLRQVTRLGSVGALVGLLLVATGRGNGEPEKHDRTAAL